MTASRRAAVSKHSRKTSVVAWVRFSEAPVRYHQARQRVMTTAEEVAHINTLSQSMQGQDLTARWPLSFADGKGEAYHNAARATRRLYTHRDINCAGHHRLDCRRCTGRTGSYSRCRSAGADQPDREIPDGREHVSRQIRSAARG